MTPTQRVEVSKKATHKKEQFDAEHRGIKPKRRIKSNEFWCHYY